MLVHDWIEANGFGGPDHELAFSGFLTLRQGRTVWLQEIFRLRFVAKGHASTALEIICSLGLGHSMAARK